MTRKQCGAKSSGNTSACASCDDVNKDAPAVAKQHPEPPRVVYCAKCGRAITTDIRYCQYCGAPRQAITCSMHVFMSKLKKKRFLLLLGIIAVSAILLIIGRSSASPAAIYYKFDAICAANLSTLDTYQISDNTGSVENNYVISAYTFTSSDGRYLYYPDGSAIYRRDLKADPKAKDATIKIDSDMGYFFEVTPDNKAVYIKQSNNGLYLNDGNNRERVARDVSFCTMNADGTKLIYGNEDSDIYILDIRTLTEQKIVPEATLLWVSDNFTTVYYQKNGNLYQQIIGENSKKIASAFSSFIARMDDGTLYYTKSETETIALADYVNDDMLEADAALSEPNIADFQTQEPYTNWWGNISYATATDYDAYDAARNAYSEKLMRDELRMQITGLTMDFNHQKLYAYKGGEETIITNNFAYTLITSDSGLLVYTKTTFIPPEKVNISEISDIYAISEAVSSYQSKNNAVYGLLNGTETLLIELDGAASAVDDAIFYSEDEKKLYYIDSFDKAESCGTLKFIAVSDKEFSPPQVIDEDVSTCTFDSITNTLLYFKELRNGCGDLYIDGIKIDSDVSLQGLLLSKDAKTLYYMTDVSKDGLNATLIKWSNADKERVAYDVAQAVLVSDKLVYLADYSALDYRGDLYLYTGTEPKLIDNDVSYLFDTERYSEKPFIYFIDFSGSSLYGDE